MLYRNEWQREDFAAGRMRERLELINNFLKRRFGEMPNDLTERITHLSNEQSTALVDAMHDFQTAAEAQLWLSKIDIAQPVR